jgi:hypothetical protein
MNLGFEGLTGFFPVKEIAFRCIILNLKSTGQMGTAMTLRGNCEVD